MSHFKFYSAEECSFIFSKLKKLKITFNINAKRTPNWNIIYAITKHNKKNMNSLKVDITNKDIVISLIKNSTPKVLKYA